MARAQPAKRAALLGIWYYQKHISPKRPPRCWMKPTCSEYGRQAVHRHGFRKGVVMAADRVRRCGEPGRRNDFYATAQGDYPAVRCYEPVQ